MKADVENIYYIHEKMMNSKILLVYKGALDNNVLNSLLANAKNQLTILKTETKVRKKIYSIMVECLENMKRYNTNQETHEPESNPSYPLFIWGENNNGFYITSGNLIKMADVPPLKDRLEGMKNLNKDELKAKYRNAILKSKVRKDTGAGLGFLDMAIKSDNQMTYDFKHIMPDVSFFTLNINV